MNINDDRFGNIRKEGRENLGSGRKYTALRSFTGRWVLCKGSRLNLDLGRVTDEASLQTQGHGSEQSRGDSC